MENSRQVENEIVNKAMAKIRHRAPSETEAGNWNERAREIADWMVEAGYVDESWIIEQAALAESNLSPAESVERITGEIARRIAAALADAHKAGMPQWQPIETAPKDGSRVLCVRKDWDCPCFLVWKINHRIVEAHRYGKSLELATAYFGDPGESDDYELAQENGRPTHWLRIDPPPC